MLSGFARSLSLPGLAIMDRKVVRHWLTSPHQKGNKSATVSVRYRSLNPFFNWCVTEEERSDNPMDRVDPPKIPSEIQAYYQPHEVGWPDVDLRPGVGSKRDRVEDAGLASYCSTCLQFRCLSPFLNRHAGQ